MATQQVHNVCYMVDCVLDLSQEITQAAIISQRFDNHAFKYRSARECTNWRNTRFRL